MRELMSLPMADSVLAEYGDLKEACRGAGCGGLEIVWGGETAPALPRGLAVGYHLTFWPDWVDFWNGDREALRRKFGGEAAWTAFYGGPAGQAVLLDAYRADLERALSSGAEYVVFHVSDVSLEEGYTYRWAHTDEAVIDCAARAVNLLLDGREWPFALLLENQWWPGFTFTNPALTRRLLDAVHYPGKGIMLDVGHLMNANPGITCQRDGVAFLHRMLDAHGDLCRYIRGIHLHQSVSGAYVRSAVGRLPEGWAQMDYLERFAVSYGHILRIDTHAPWTEPSIAGAIRRIAPEYLVHELSAGSRREREERLRLQRETLYRGGGTG